MSETIEISLADLSREMERCRKERDEYKKFGDNEMASAYQYRIDALQWVIRIGE